MLRVDKNGIGLYRLGAALTAILALVLLSLTAVAILSPAGMDWDFGANYYRVGVALFHGKVNELYSVDIRVGYKGAPITAYLFAPLGAWQPRSALLVFKLICAACCALGFWVLYPLFKQTSKSRIPRAQLPFYLAAILSCGALWFLFKAGGQSTAHCFLLIAIAYAGYVRRNLWIAAAALSIAILVKPFLAPILFVFLFARDWQFLFRLAAFMSGEIALSVMLFGFKMHQEWIRQVGRVVGLTIQVWWNNSALWNVMDCLWFATSGPGIRSFYKLSDPMLTNEWMMVMHALRIVIFAAFGVLTWRLTRLHGGIEARRAIIFDAAILFCMIESPVVWPHYLLLLFPSLILAAARFGEGQRTVAVLGILAIVSTLSTLSHSAQNWVLDLLRSHVVLEGLAAGILGSVTLWITVACFAVSCAIEIRKPSPPQNGANYAGGMAPNANPETS